MPAIRSTPAAKPVKTERSHEENQERAYIAASRRSDRSLEARIESARRASEIHKRRTGRSLRVTEQDVINEEMYEEEDDDLPMQYRRLTAHLQTQNADFDRRLAAYLTNHVAMRSALGQAVSDAWQNNQFSNIGQFMNPGMMQQPLQQQQQQSGMPTSMLPPQMPNRSPTSYRQTPYPVANAQGMRPAHGRSVSMASPNEFAFQNQHTAPAHESPVDNIKQEDRRASMPISAMPQTPLSGSVAPTSTHSSPTRAVSRKSSSSNSAKQQQFSQQQPTPPAQADFAQPSPPGFQLRLPVNHRNLDPLTTTLPMETQQLLAANPYEFTFNNDNTSHMAQNTNKQTYSYNPNGRPKSKSSSPTQYPAMPQMGMSGMGSMSGMGGMNSTLAPSAFDMTANYATSSESAFSPSSYAFGGMGFNNDMFTSDLLKEPLGGESGTVTPGEGDWAGFLTNDAWEEQPVAKSGFDVEHELPTCAADLAALLYNTRHLTSAMISTHWNMPACAHDTRFKAIRFFPTVRMTSHQHNVNHLF